MKGKLTNAGEVETVREGIVIGGRAIGPGQPVYIVAEVSANHRQDYAQAVRIIEAARESGADAVKLQTYTPDTITIDCRDDAFQIGRGTVWEGRTLHELYGEAWTPWEWQPRLMEVARGLGLDLFSTPFDPTAVAFLENLKVPVYKIASFELIDHPLIECVARTGKPLILSTGMADVQEIHEAVDAFRAAGGRELVLLKCTSAYPAVPEEMNLRAIRKLAAEFDVPVGLSDHSMELAVPVAAVACGACVIEKHLTLERAQGGPDGSFSLEPDEFRGMVDAVRVAEKALGAETLAVGERELTSRVFRRSLFAVADIRAGELFTPANVRSIRPGHGLHPREISRVIGCRARCDLVRGTPLRPDHLGSPGEGEVL